MTKKAAHVIENNLTDEIPSEELLEGDSDLYGPKDPNKVANAKRRKRKRNRDNKTEISTNVDTSEAIGSYHDDYRSHMLFCDDSQVNEKRKNTKELKLVKVRQKTNQKVKTKQPKTQAQNSSDTSIVSEGPDNNDFVIEETKEQILPRKMVHLQERVDQLESDNHTTNPGNVGKESVDLLEDVNSGQDNTDACPSIEIPRDAIIEGSALCLGSLTHSPSFLIESSDEESFIDSERGRKCNFVGVSSTKLGGSSSYGSKTAHSSSSQMGSDYTYSYVSTYTDATGTVSTKTITSSPPVKMKVCPNLNSTVCRGKDCIGDIEFPESISPVVDHRVHVLPQAKYMQSECTFRSDNQESVRRKDKRQLHTPKCSSVLFGSENICSLRVVFDNLSTIHSGDMGTNNERQLDNYDRMPSIKHSSPYIVATHEDNVTSRQHGLKESHESKQSNIVKASTPCGLAKKLSLDISPISTKTMDCDELQVHRSLVACSSDICVPSLTEPGSGCRLVTEQKHDTSAAHSHRQIRQESTPMAASSQSDHDGPCHLHSYSKHSLGTDKTICQRSALPTIVTPFMPAFNVEEVNILGKENIRSQDDRTPYLKDRELQATIGNSQKKTPCTPLNDSTSKMEAHRKKYGVLNKHSMLVEQYSESHNEKTGIPATHRKQHLQQIDSFPGKNCGSFSQDSVDYFSTKKQWKKRSRKRHKIQSVSSICYINRLCMASQEYLRAEAHRLHQ